MPTIIITEKIKAAEAIAEALGKFNTIKQSGVSVFYNPIRNLYIIPLRGHIMIYENTSKYKVWTANDPREIITDKYAIAKIPTDYAGPFINALKIYAKQCSECIIATDADIEGCNIGIIDALTNNILPINKTIKVSQLWLSTLQKQDILAAFSKLIPPKYDWANSGEARAFIDAMIGFSATREISLSLKPILQKLNTNVASIGRVQTSLLYLLYLREKEIREFQPNLYWVIVANLVSNSTGHAILLKIQHVNNPFTDKFTAEEIYHRIQNATQATITSISNTPKIVNPPYPLNTSNALMLLTKNLGISASVALQTLEDLYLNKLISYPRTDSNKYPTNFDHIQYLRKMVTHPTYGAWTAKLFQANRVNPRNGSVDAGDHPPITPIESVSFGSSHFKSVLQEKVYDLIARHYLALFGEEAEEVQTNIDVDIEHELFVGKFTILIRPGFFEIAPFLKPKYDIDMKLTRGILPVKDISLEEKQTQPPTRYTDTTILKLMEKHNLGTKSTRPSHIETLEKRNYIQRIQKTYFVMELGYILIDSLKTVWMPFLDPKFTEWVETHLDAVKDGKITMNTAVDTVREEFLKLFDKFRSLKPQFITQMRDLEQSGNFIKGRKGITSPGSTINSKNYPTNQGSGSKLSFSLCPQCKTSKMQLIVTKNKKKFLMCTNESCKLFLPLPKNGNPRLLKGTCSICGFNIIKISGKKDNKTLEYYLCPICWKQGLNSQEKGKGFCSACQTYHVEKGICKERSPSVIK